MCMRKIPSRRQRRRAHPRRIIRLADLLHERVETGFPQQRLQPVVERVSRRARHLPPTSPSSRPDPPPTAPSPSPITLPKRRNRRESELPDFVNGLLTSPRHTSTLPNPAGRRRSQAPPRSRATNAELPNWDAELLSRTQPTESRGAPRFAIPVRRWESHYPSKTIKSRQFPVDSVDCTNNHRDRPLSNIGLEAFCRF